MDDALRSALLMKRIDILGTKEEAIAQAALKFGQSEVRRIWLHCLVPQPTLRVELPHQRRVGRECFRRRDVFHPIAAPQSVGPAKRR